jgi:hypothetical protein
MRMHFCHVDIMKTARTGSNGRTARFDFATETAFGEVKERLSDIRTLRDALAQTATNLAHEDAKNGYLLLVEPRLGLTTITDLVAALKKALHPDVAERLKVVATKGEDVVLQLGTVPPQDLEHIWRCVAESKGPGTRLPQPDKQREVLLLILHQWFIGKIPVTSRWLEETVGCHYRTVSAAVERLGPVVQRSTGRSIDLKYFPQREWKQLLVVAQKVRSTIHYTDTSDQPRSPESLLQRLTKLNRDDIAVGGVIGAKHYYPDLDIVGTPRLDLCVHAPGDRIDLDFVKRLDPALERTRDPHRPAQLALHFLRRKKPLFHRADKELPAPDPVECLLELYMGRLDQQAAEFEAFLTMRGRELSGES